MKNARNYLLFILILFFGFMINVHAEEIEIISITCENKYNGELRDNVNAEVNGLTIKVDDSYFFKKDDYFKCKLVIKNNQDEDAMIDSESISSKSDENITYELTAEGENLIKKGESKTYNLLITYIKEVTEARTLENTVEIIVKNDKVTVPDTGRIFILAIVMLVVMLIMGVIILYTKKANALMILVLLAIILMPTGHALLKVSIKIENKILVETDPRYKVSYTYYDALREDEANKYLAAEKDDSLCATIDDEEYCDYQVTKLEGYYKAGDRVEIKNMTSHYLQDTCSSCVVDAKKSDGKFELKRLENECQCNENFEIADTEAIDSRDTYWKVLFKENEDEHSYNYEGGQLESNTCHFELTDEMDVRNSKKSYTIQRLASTTCDQLLVRPSASFEMPSHNVNYERVYDGR